MDWDFLVSISRPVLVVIYIDLILSMCIPMNLHLTLYGIIDTLHVNKIAADISILNSMNNKAK
jgi:hypothetical protein